MNIYEYLCHARSGAIFGTFGCLEWLFVPRFFIVWLSSKWLTPLESNLMQIIEWRYILVIWTSLPGFRLQTNLLYRVWRAFAVGGICLISQVVTEIPPVFENTWIWISSNIWLQLPIIRPFTPSLFVFPRSQQASLLRLYVATSLVIIIFHW